MKEKRIYKHFSLVIFIISLLACFAYSQEQENSLPNQLGTFIDGSPTIKERVFSKRETPELISVKLSPEIPLAGQKTQIIVRMKNDPSDVEVIYGKMTGESCYKDDVFPLENELFSGILEDDDDAIDAEKCDASWNSFQLKQSKDNSWIGEFPEFESRTKIFYSIRAVDTSKNVYVTIPCNSWFSDAGFMGSLFLLRYVETDCVNSNEPCGNILPRGGMMKIADSNDVDIEALKQSMAQETANEKDEPNGLSESFKGAPGGTNGKINDKLKIVLEEAHTAPKRDAEKLPSPDIAEDLDIQDMRVGFDEDNIYLDVAVKRNISSGSVYPLNALAYIAIVVNPAIDNPQDADSLAKAIGTFFYSRLFSSFIFDDDMGPCHYGYNQGIDYIMDETNAECFVERNHLIFKIKRTVFGDEPIKQLKIMMSTSSLTEVFSEWIVYDSTPFTTVMFDENAWFVVE